MSDPAASNVVPISADRGPPVCEFEREAVDVLLSAIRKMREKNGVGPTDLVLVLTAAEGDSLHHLHSWYCPSGDTSKNFAFAAALLAKKTFEP